jgi:hypothetical protein
VVVSPAGFSDLEVVRSVSDRIWGSGDIVIRTQSETDSNLRMQRIHNPLRVAGQVREVMSKPIVRIENDADEKK